MWQNTVFLILILPWFALAKMGFYESLPEFEDKEEELKSKVFRFYGLGPLDREVPIVEKQNYISNYGGADLDVPLEHITPLLKEQFRRCENKGADTCSIQMPLVGTAFLGVDDGLLWTAYHNIQYELYYDLVEYESSGGAMYEAPLFDRYFRGWAPIVVLVNHKGEIIYEPEMQDEFPIEQVMFPTYNFGKLTDKGKERVSFRTDVAVFMVPFLKDQGHIPQADQKKLWGDMYGLGFPSKTKGRAKYDTPDSKGDRIYFSVGKALTVERTFLLHVGGLGSFNSLSESEKNEFPYFMVMNDSDAKFGSSGQPFLNSYGEVIGIQTQFIPNGGVPQPAPDIIGSFGPTFRTIFDSLP